MWSTARFRPPALVTDYPWQSVLEAAFRTEAAGVEGILSEFETNRLGLRDLIADRVARADIQVAEEVGERAIAITRNNGMRWLARLSALREIGKAEIPIAPLKYAALLLSGQVACGARSAVDIDLLVPRGRASELAERLKGFGYVTHVTAPSPHQLPPMISTSGVCIEIHLTIPGIWAVGRHGHVAFEELKERGCLHSTTTPAGDMWLPTTELMAAHALVHGIAHHGFGPQTYPTMRMFADLAELHFGQERSIVDQVLSLTQGTLSPTEVEAAARATVALGERPMDGTQPEDLLVRHFIAAATDPVYAQALRFQSLFWRSAEDGAAHALGRKLSTATAWAVVQPYLRGLGAEVKLRLREMRKRFA